MPGHVNRLCLGLQIQPEVARHLVENATLNLVCLGIEAEVTTPSATVQGICFSTRAREQDPQEDASC